MASKLSVRFFLVEKDSDATPELGDVLNVIIKQSPSNREKIVISTEVRLERCEDYDHYIGGEVTRIQKEDLPSEVTPEGVNDLSVENPLGYGCAYMYNPTLGVLAMQFNNQIISPGKFAKYLREYDSQYRYTFTPILKKDAWSDFEASPMKNFTFRIATPENLEFLDDIESKDVREIYELSRVYEAREITIKMSMGHSRETFSDKAKDLVKHVFSSADVKSAKVKVVDISDPIDLLSETIKESKDLVLPTNQEKRYKAKCAYLKECMNKHHSLFQELYSK